jgi:hypothetical protein
MFPAPDRVPFAGFVNSFSVSVGREINYLFRASAMIEPKSINSADGWCSIQALLEKICTIRSLNKKSVPSQILENLSLESDTSLCTWYVTVIKSLHGAGSFLITSQKTPFAIFDDCSHAPPSKHSAHQPAEITRVTCNNNLLIILT